MEDNNSKPRGFGNKAAYPFQRKLSDPIDKDSHGWLYEDIPSPVSLDYPYRNLSAIVGAIPSALDVDATKKRITDFFNSYTKSSMDEGLMQPRNEYALEAAIGEAYTKDIINQYKKTHPPKPKAEYDIEDPHYVKDALETSFDWPESLKKSIKYQFPEENESWLDKTIAKHYSDTYYDPFLNRVVIGPTSSGDWDTLRHEMAHADNFKNSSLLDRANLVLHGTSSKHTTGELKDKQYTDPFELSRDIGEARHFIPLRLNGKDEPRMLLEPFLKAGMQADTTPEPTWDKIKKLIGVTKY